MKILCVIDELGSGGAQRQLVGLAVAFKQRGNDVSFLVYHDGNFFKEALDRNAIPVTLIQESNYWKRLLKMRRFIRTGGYNAVIAFLEAAAFICEIAGVPGRNWKLVVGERSANPQMLASYRLRFYRWCHLFADYVVANSHQNIKLVKKINPLLRSKKCKVVYNLIDENKWKPAEDYRPLQDGKLHLIVVASHQYLKNAVGFIQSVAQLTADERNRLRISWYGNVSADNSYNDAVALIEHYHLEKIISFYPATKLIRDKMQQADALGLFSFYEGLPNVVCEAMMLGKPVVCSDVSDVSEIVDSSHFIFDPKSINDIAKTISYILTLSKESLLTYGQRNRERAISLFSNEKVISDYLALLN